MKTTTAHPIYLKAKAGQYIAHKDIATLIRSALKRTFPGTAFSVTTKTYSGGGSVDVSWEDGPTHKQVEEVVDRFETKGFDGMIDLAYYKSLWISPDGSVSLARSEGTSGSNGSCPEVIGSSHSPDAVLVENIAGCYVHANRRHSAEHMQRAIAAYRAENWGYLERLEAAGQFSWDMVSVKVYPWGGCEIVAPVVQEPASCRWLSDLLHRKAAELEG